MIDLYEEAKQLSGALQTGSGHIYSSYTHPNFNHRDKTSRNTKDRLNLLGVPFDLCGKTVLDLGCNTGAVSLELALRGARVTGYEFNNDRVTFCRKLFDRLGVVGTFEQADLNNGIPGEEKYDIVLSLAVDGYLSDPLSYYKQLAERTTGICWLESNYPNALSNDLGAEIASVRDCMTGLFKNVQYIGQSTPGGRRMFICGHVDIGELPSKMERKGQWYERRISSLERWEELKRLAEPLASLQQVPTLYFPEPQVMAIREVPGVRWDQADKENLPSYRRQFIEFVVKLNGFGLAHRDLHYDNLLFHGNTLWVLDWEHLCENKVPLEHCYDLTGQGCELPGRSPIIGPSYVFGRLKSIGVAFGLQLKDFTNYRKMLAP